MVRNFFKYPPKCSQIIKELLATLVCNIVKLKLKIAPSLMISHKIVRYWAKTNVPTIAILPIPLLVWIQSSKGLESKIQGVIAYRDGFLAQIALLARWLEGCEYGCSRWKTLTLLIIFVASYSSQSYEMPWWIPCPLLYRDHTPKILFCIALQYKRKLPKMIHLLLNESFHHRSRHIGAQKNITLLKLV